MTEGTYVLLVELARSQNVRVGALGEIDFSQGFYSCVGSAMSGLEARLARHLRHSKKRRWHIDYLLERANPYDVVLAPGEERLECAVATALSERLLSIRRFGSSDCGCAGHLFFAPARSDLEIAVMKTLAGLNADWYRFFAVSRVVNKEPTQGPKAPRKC